VSRPRADLERRLRVPQGVTARARGRDGGGGL